MNVIIAGGTGFIGGALVEHLLDLKSDVKVLSRRAKSYRVTNEKLEYIGWDGTERGDLAGCLEGADAVINLSGESIGGKRWSAAQKRVILESRIGSTRAIVKAVSKVKVKPFVFINASAVGYYGDTNDNIVDESSPKGDDFLSDICDSWENEAKMAESFGVRTVVLRQGLVLGKDKGVLQRFLLPYKLFAGGPLGSGKQWISWIHLEDLLKGIVYILVTPELKGPVNMVAPNPVTMNEFASSLGKALRRPSFFRVPDFLLKIALGEMSETVLSGQRATPAKLLESGFVFSHPEINETLKSIIGQ